MELLRHPQGDLIYIILLLLLQLVPGKEKHVEIATRDIHTKLEILGMAAQALLPNFVGPIVDSASGTDAGVIAHICRHFSVSSRKFAH